MFDHILYCFQVLLLTYSTLILSKKKSNKNTIQEQNQENKKYHTQKKTNKLYTNKPHTKVYEIHYMLVNYY